ncbi:hypothetical protein C8Q77DRAFT_1057120 [Trametes polyzona]|nr:hypothetical protein C8Q77DRAFT_1057120 [Trametes polyzona]
MKGLKQTRLSFAPLPTDETPSARRRQDSSTATPSTSTVSPSGMSKPKKGTQSANGRGRRSALDYVEIPPPPKRSSRTKTAPKASPRRTSPNKSTASSAAPNRKASLKRKASPDPQPYAQRVDSDGFPGNLLTPEGRPGPNRDTSMRASPPKKMRLSSPESDLTPLPSSSAPDIDSDELVPTSQSDEQELTLPRIIDRDPALVKESVAKWRQETHANPPSRAQSPPPLDPIENTVNDGRMDVDSVFTESTSFAVPYPHTPRTSGRRSPSDHDPVPDTVTRNTVPFTSSPPVATPRIKANPPASPSDAFSALTPPPSSDPASGPEPDEELEIVRALDMQSKTDLVIANIKAKARAAAHSSPEQSPIDLDALEESDSDLDSDDATGVVAKFAQDTKSKTSAAFSAVAETASVPRYNLRRATPSKAAKTAVPLFTQPRKPSKVTPIDSLLRQKDRDERTGRGMAVIRSAEAIAAAAKEEAKKGLREEMADEQGSDSDDDWRAGIGLLGASTRETKRAKSSRKSTNSGGSESEDDDASTSKAGKTVGDILESDSREQKAHKVARLNAEPNGVPLWDPKVFTEDVDSNMDVDYVLPTFSADASANPMFRLLANATQSNDASQVSALLVSGLVTVVPPGQHETIIPWLFDVVFSNVPSSLSDLAYTQLVRLAPLLTSLSSGLPLPSVLSALIRLGTSKSVLEGHGWTVPEVQRSQSAFNTERHQELVRRLVSLMGAYAIPSGKSLRDLFFATLLVGMDPATSDDLLVEVHQACDKIACALEAAQGDTLELEASLCEKVVAFGKTLSPSNQARLISLFPCISPSTTRMARNLGRALLLDAPVSARAYEKLPALAPVLDLITPQAGSGGYFDVVSNADKEGYHEALASRIAVLSRVLSDIDEYTLLEMEAAKERKRLAKEHEQQQREGATDEVGKKEEREEPLSILEQIRAQFDLLHNKIVDTRAAHLDRSRAKAAMKLLETRVHYQRIAALKSGTGRPRTIRTYFHPPS